jgi:hypothetical protein
MSDGVTSLIKSEARKRLSVVSTAVQMTFRPSAFAADMSQRREGGDLGRAMKFFLAAVGIVLAIEALFSFVFNTAFSDIVHHAFPILVVLAGSVTIYVLLKMLLTQGIGFKETAEGTLYVGGGALLVMISVIFAMLTADFLVSYQGVVNSPCKSRTIICLLSGGALNEYDVVAPSQGALGTSFPFIILVMLVSAIHYSRVLAKVFKATMGVSPWRTYLAAAISIVGLSPVSLIAINTIYRALYS